MEIPNLFVVGGEGGGGERVIQCPPTDNTALHSWLPL